MNSTEYEIKNKNLHLVKIDRDNFWEVIDLRVDQEQENFVASNKHITTLKLGRCTEAVNTFLRALEVNSNFDASASAMLLRIHEELKK